MKTNDYDYGKNEMITSNKVLMAISDEIAANIFKLIANSNRYCNGSILLSKMKITRKQYYSRMHSLTKAGLIRRKNGIYYLTSFGKVIYNYQLEIETAVSYHWKLEALDSILLSQSSDKAKIPLEEKVNLVDKLIDNHKIKEIIFPAINNNDNNDAVIAADSCSTGNYNRHYDFRQEREQEAHIHL
jgi:hypothetical protein